MSKFNFLNESFKKSVALAKTVKPASGDLSFSFSSSGLSIFSYDDRRFTVVNLPPESSEVDPNFSNEEFYIFADRTAAFDSDLENISIKVNKDSLAVVVSDDSQKRRFSLKKKSADSKRPSVPVAPDVDYTTLDKSILDEVLYLSACSAGVKDAKTEDDMRIMQVHFYGEGKCAMSTTRFHGSLVRSDNISIDTSIVSSDIPIIRSFCSKILSSEVNFGQDSNRIYFVDPSTNSFLSMSKVSTNKPPLRLIPDNYKTRIKINQEVLSKSLKWASLVIERTQRVNFSATEEDGLSITFSDQSVKGIPVKFLDGESVSVDIPVNILTHITGYISGDVILKFDHIDPTYASLIEVSEEDSDTSKAVHSFHYLTSMKSHGN